MRSVHIALAVLLLGVAWGVFASAAEDEAALKQRALAEMATLSAAMNTLFVDCGELPVDRTGLDALIRDPGFKGWNGPYADSKLLIDPWKTPYQYRLGQANFTLRSAGQDRKFNTNDDVTTGEMK